MTDNQKPDLIPESHIVVASLTRNLSLRRDDDTLDVTHDRRWRVAGKFDYIELEKKEDVRDLGRDGKDARLGLDSRQLVLVPLATPELRISDDELSILTLAPGSRRNEWPFLVVTSITLSMSSNGTSAYHGTNTQARASQRTTIDVPRGGIALAAIRNAIVLSDALDLEHTPTRFFFASLGGPDLVVVDLPRNPVELQSTDKFVQILRTMRLAELDHARWLPAGRTLHQEWPEARPGHACASVAPLLAVNRHASEIYEYGDDETSFRRAERSSGLTISFRLRVDCGHEQQVVDGLERVCEPREVLLDEAPFELEEELPNSTRIAWDSHTLSGRFTTVRAFMRAWDLWFNASWRALNLLHSRTTIGFACRHTAFYQKAEAWPLTTSMESELTRIQKACENFAEKFLNPTQQAELAGIVKIFQTCFSRHDLVGTGRDLLPFFRQLAAAFTSLDLWENYFDGRDLADHGGADPDVRQGNSAGGLERLPSTPDHVRAIAFGRALDFAPEFRDFLSHVGRAVRNRVEHRAGTSDPPFPLTIRYDSGKILSAYTLVVFLCWDIFHRKGEQERDVVGAKRFAVCLHSGTAGVVRRVELFRNFRRFVEAATGPLSSRGDAEWCAHLLVLDLSGEAIWCPEALVVHCMHEVAEAIEWMEDERHARLRQRMNLWLLETTVEILTDCMLDATAEVLGDEGLPPPGFDSEAERALLDFASLYVGHCVNVYIQDGDEIGFPLHDVQSAADAVARLGPHRFMTTVRLAIERVGQSPETPRACVKAGRAGDDSLAWLVDDPAQVSRPPLAHIVAAAAGHRDTSTRLKALVGLAEEISADVGMWASLWHVLTTHGCAMGEEDRRVELTKVFKTILAQSLVRTGGLGGQRRTVEMVLVRWAAQTIAASAPEYDWSSRMRVEFVSCSATLPWEEVFSEVERTVNAHAWPGKGNLMELLGEYRPYGGSLRIDLADLTRPMRSGESREGEPETDKVMELFVEAWKAPTTATRVALLLRLWAESTFLASYAVVEANKAAVDDDKGLGVAEWSGWRTAGTEAGERAGGGG